MTSPELRRALRRSRVRCEILLCLLVLRTATAADIARRTGIDPENLRGALYGDGERYRHDHALVALGLVGAAVDRGEVAYSLTRPGREVAQELRREILAAWSRPPGARS